MELEAKKTDFWSKYGKPACSFGYYELTRLWGAVWPMILAGIASYFSQRSADLTAEHANSLGIIVGAAGKLVTQFASNNTDRKT